MNKKLLTWVNLALSGTVCALALGSLGIALGRPSSLPTPSNPQTRTTLPPSGFNLPKLHYDSIAASALSLKSSPPSMLLPDLRQHLTYYGANGRPDVANDHSLLHFALANNKIPFSVAPGEKLYLFYDKKQNPPRYVFSPQNAETALWVEASPKGSEAVIKVSMKNELGEVVQEPVAYAEFNLPEKEFARFTTGNWEIGKWRVDGSLLARQKARWYGLDLFIEQHGGEEYSTSMNKQRIDFEDEEEIYSCFIAQGDSLVWENNRWKSIVAGENSRGKPLLHVKKVDERLINFELWDVEGKSKLVLNMIKSSEPWMPANIVKDFKFVGARTRTQCVFEINEDRMLLKPQDWLLMTENGWKKLTTPDEIDDYVNRKTTGALFVFDGLVKKDDKQILVGTMYNSARTELHTVELAVQQSSVTIMPVIPEGMNPLKDEGQARVIIPKMNYKAKN